MQRLLFTFMIIFPHLIFSQIEEEHQFEGYFVKMNKTLNLRLDLDNDVRSFVYDLGDEEYSIEPNTNLRLATAINYRFISLKIGFSPKFLASGDSDLKGNTKIFRLSLNLFIKDIHQNFDYNQVQGYYIKGAESPVGAFIDEEVKYLILPDMKTLSITGNTRYRFNENYSFKAVANQNEIQLKSAGSFVPSLYYGYFEVTDQTTPEDIKSLFVIANAGYYHTFVFSKNWYSNLGISAGLGAEFNKVIQRSEEGESETSHNNIASNIKTQIGLGYNSKRFYGGTAPVGDATGRDENSVIKFNNVRGYFKIFIGYRFDAPQSFEKGMDWIESKNPFKKK